MFKKNVGTTDRVIRILLGLAILGAGWYYSLWWGLLGLLPLLTGVLGNCGLYSLLGINTCGCKKGDTGCTCGK